VPTIDLNCDLGEGGSQDARLMAMITSANIACGGHAGDAETMRTAVRLARQHRVAIGAHPGLPDRAGFGRDPGRQDPAELYEIVRDQVRTLAAIAPLRHVKPHGALYHRAGVEPEVARAVVAAVRDVEPALALYGLPGSELEKAGTAAGLRVVTEGFADRRYEPGGRLVPRSEPDALIERIEEAVAHVLGMVRDKQVRSRDGSLIALQVETLCVHGDHPGTLELARRLRAELERAGFQLRAPA